jgi:hypothetical protein
VDTLHDAPLRWTAVAAVLTGAALLVAVIGLPLAIYQLVALDRDLVTRRTELRTKVNDFRQAGQKVLDGFSQPGDYSEKILPVKEWGKQVTAFIQTDLADDAEAEDFRREGSESAPEHEVRAKLNYLRDKLLPKVIAGFW